MAEAVVQRLQRVEVDEHHRDVVPRFGADDGVLERFEDPAPVRKPGQPVVAGVVHQPLERPVAFNRDAREMRAVLHQRQVLR
jgi:hypothetical protein